MMKKQKLILLAFSIISFSIMACNNAPSEEEVKEEMGTSQTEEEARELLEAAEQDLKKEKEQTMNELQQQRDSIEKSINTYKAKIDNKLVDAKAETRDAANKVISKMEAAKQKVDATEENWDKVKLETKSFMNDVKREADTLTNQIESMLK